MKALLHICCGPCAIGPVNQLRAEGVEVEGIFYNPNIHPASEYQQRAQAVLTMAEKMKLDVFVAPYDFEDFLKTLVSIDERAQQHVFCWEKRLKVTAQRAKELGISYFTTTLLSSPYQDVEEIKRLGNDIAKTLSLTFLPKNFRKVFQESHRLSKEWGLYHQLYCGCLYSQKESIEQRKKKKAQET